MGKWDEGFVYELEKLKADYAAGYLLIQPSSVVADAMRVRLGRELSTEEHMRCLRVANGEERPGCDKDSLERMLRLYNDILDVVLAHRGVLDLGISKAETVSVLTSIIAVVKS